MQKDFNKSDLTTFLHKRINEYENKQKDAQAQLDEIQQEYQKLMMKINSQKSKYKSTVYLLS